MDIPEHQLAILSMIKIGYDLCVQNPLPHCEPEQFYSMTKVEQENYLKYETKCECYRMLVFNYLVALIGYKKNDKCSIYHHPPKGKEQLVKDFVDNNKDVIDKIYISRDKVYSHFDEDFAKEIKRIEYDEVKKIIDFIYSVLLDKGNTNEI